MDIAALKENFKRVFDNIAEACVRSRRDPNEVRLIAVTKTVEVQVIKEILEMGQVELGESRAQNLVQKKRPDKRSAQQKDRIAGIEWLATYYFP